MYTLSLMIVKVQAS